LEDWLTGYSKISRESFEIREDAPKDEKAEEALLGVVRLVNTIVVDYQRS
jgi:hypothetical protein